MSDNPEQQFTNGRVEYFSRMYRMHYSAIYRFVFARVRNPEFATDIVQDVFTKAFPSIIDSGERASVLPLFYTIARNLLIDFYRKKREVLTTPEDLDLGESGDASDSLALAHERSLMVEHALAALNEDQRAVITLLYMEELRIEEVADIVGKTEETVRQIKSRALRQLRSILNYDE